MERRNKRISTVAEILAVASAGLAILSVATPYWAILKNSQQQTTAYRGLWTECTVRISYSSPTCSSDSNSFFGSPIWAKIAGAIAAVGVGAIALASIVGILLFLMLRTEEKVIIAYRPAVVLRLVLAIISVLMSVLAAGLFAAQMTQPSIDFGWSFYVQLLVILLEVLLTVASVFDFKFSRQLGGDPTYTNRDPNGLAAFTFSNPSVVDETDGSSNRSDTGSNRSTSSIISSGPVSTQPNGKHHSRSSNSKKNISKNNSGRNSAHKGRQGAASPKAGSINRSNRPGSIRGSKHGSSRPAPSVAVTPSSGQPYQSNGKSSPPSSVEGNSILNGSIGSIGSSVGDGSVFSEGSVSSNPLVRSPLKSSLKKPKPKNVPSSPGSIEEGLGFENKGFLESRTGSIKRVRIESQSTDV